MGIIPAEPGQRGAISTWNGPWLRGQGAPECHTQGEVVRFQPAAVYGRGLDIRCNSQIKGEMVWARPACRMGVRKRGMDVAR